MLLKETPSTITDLRIKSFELAKEMGKKYADYNDVLQLANEIFNFISKDFLPK